MSETKKEISATNKKVIHSLFLGVFFIVLTVLSLFFWIFPIVLIVYYLRNGVIWQAVGTGIGYLCLIVAEIIHFYQNRKSKKY